MRRTPFPVFALMYDPRDGSIFGLTPEDLPAEIDVYVNFSKKPRVVLDLITKSP